MEFTEEYAKGQDAQDTLAHCRDEYLFPQHKGKNCLYFTGNSLGLQSKRVKEYLDQELTDWAEFGVEGHFKAKRPWYSYHENFSEPMAKIVGAKPSEVVVMNGLTTNIHLLMASFYRPSRNRTRVITEYKAFPSDQYAIESQIKMKGYDMTNLIDVRPDSENRTLISEDIIIEAIEHYQDDVALVFIGGVNYYTGQLFDMKRITEAAHKYDILVGFDLAHAAGNVELHLHDWNVDFAAWCSYKYLNAGPGSAAGVFIHEKHASNTKLQRFAGWWGHNKEKRFMMESGFDPIPTAEGWQLSNAPVFSMAPLLANLSLVEEVTFPALLEKSKRLTAYLEYVIQEVSENSEVNFEIITPKEEHRRGCQLSVFCHGAGKPLFDELTKQGVVADWREPNVIRLAPVPLYNNFSDVYEFGRVLEHAVKEISK